MRSLSRRLSVGAGVVSLINFLSSAAFAGDQLIYFRVPTEQIQALDIQTAPLQSQADSIKPSFPAQVVIPASAEQVISSPVAGLVVELLVQQNQFVGTGAALVRIASPELGQLQLQLLQATARATLARQVARREQALFDEGIIPQRRMYEAQAGLKETAAALNQAKAALRLSGMSVATIEHIAASGNPQDSITLTATQAGIVTGIAVKSGQQVEPATALLHVMQTDTLWLEIQIPVTEGAHWEPGTALKIAGKEVVARLVSVGTTVAADSQTLLLRAVIEGKTNQVRPGESVAVELSVAAMEDSWDVPLPAIAHDGNQAYVFARTAEGFAAKPITVVASAGQRVRVQGPLKTGEQIAVSGVVALKGAWLNAEGK
ncbi:MAG: efflux RND transporter periplasmic adaptor subunit [Gammaproteobacteria bacterium]|nr:efflux RND transporter periplasmic adaptor subunit [Gammaproteobacteria bacterium]